MIAEKLDKIVKKGSSIKQSSRSSISIDSAGDSIEFAFNLDSTEYAFKHIKPEPNTTSHIKIKLFNHIINARGCEWFPRSLI